jgi:hypothetical protein
LHRFQHTPLLTDFQNMRLHCFQHTHLQYFQNMPPSDFQYMHLTDSSSAWQ